MRQRGFTYIGLLLLIAIGGIGLATVGQIWHTEAQREREKELLFVGEQYAMAIGSYYESTPGAVKQYPASLEALLQDHRFPVMRRHLRKLYRDPVTGDVEWGLILQQGRIVGVHSLSEQRPLKVASFPEGRDRFAAAGSYSGWGFVYAAVGSQGGAWQQSNIAGVNGAEIPGNASSKPVDDAHSSGKTAPDKAIGGQPSPSEEGSGDSADFYKRVHGCFELRAIDTQACADSEYCKVHGPGSRCGLCRASILLRYNACLGGGPMPPLDGG